MGNRNGRDATGDDGQWYPMVTKRECNTDFKVHSALGERVSGTPRLIRGKLHGVECSSHVLSGNRAAGCNTLRPGE